MSHHLDYNSLMASFDTNLMHPTQTSLAPAPHAQDATTVARSQMRPQEAEAWDQYLKGQVKLPVIDWVNNRATTATGKKGQQNEKRRAEALNRLYNVQCAEASHAAWILSNIPVFLPLLGAMARVIGAERQYGSKRGMDVVTPLAHIQDLNKTISTLTQQRRRHASDASFPKREMDTRILALIERRRKLRRQRLVDRAGVVSALQHFT